MIMTRRSRLTLLSIVVFFPVVAACGEIDSGDSRAAPVNYAAIEARADAIYTSIGGTALQREAAHYLAVNHLNSGFVSCMREEGFRVASVFHPVYSGWEPNSTEGSWMGELNRPPSTQALANAASNRSEFAGDRGKAYDAASLTCEQDVPEMFVTEPKGWLDLNNKYAAVVNDVDGRLGPISDYTDCMKRAGIDYFELNGGDAVGFQGLYLALQGMMPAAPVTGEKPSPEWTEYLAIEAEALTADASCREEQYHEGLRMLAVELDAFEADSSAAIDDMSRQWQDVLDEAQRAGLPL